MKARSALPADAALPHLAQVLDGEAMAASFGRLLATQATEGAAPLQVLRCTVERIKYRPQRNCTVLYRLQLQGAEGRHFTQHVATRLCGSANEAAQRLARASTQPLRASAAGPSVAALPGLPMLGWWWPNDSRLAAARVLDDLPTLRRHALPAVLAALERQGLGTPTPAVQASAPTDAASADHDRGDAASAFRLQQLDLELVQYVPEQRLTARLALAWHRRGAPGSGRAAVVYAKASRSPDGATAHARLAALQASPAWREGRLRTPRALLWQAETGLHWQEGLPGCAWLDLPAAQAHLSEGLALQLGGQLATLHGCPLPLDRCLDGTRLSAQLAEVLPVLRAALPECGGDLARCAALLEPGLGSIAALPGAALHGDLHLRNVLVDGDRPALIDLDSMRHGPAVMELGAWIADGMYRALLDDQPPRRDAALWDALLDGYAAAGGRVPAPAQLAWATAWALLTQRAWRGVVNLKPGRFERVPALIALATDLLGPAGRAHAVPAAVTA